MSDIFTVAAKVALAGAAGQQKEGSLRLMKQEHGMLPVTVVVEEEVVGTAEEEAATPERVACILQVEYKVSLVQ